MQTFVLSEPLKRLLFLGMVALGVILLLGMGLNALFTALNPPKSASTSPTKPLQVSPLLFGTNLDFSTHDPQLQAKQIAPTQHLLQNLHVQIVRLSLPDHPTTQQITQEAQAIAQIGAVPLLSLHSTWYPGALTDNTLAMAAISHVFPQQTVYYEYGDEEDAVGMSADAYAQSWNQMIPQLKALSSHAQFIGPATYHYDAAYLQRFLQLARPLPNALSWHEFPCNASWSQQQCLAGIDSWTQHISSARSWMNQHLHTPLPFMITAWNYAANPIPTDGKSTDHAFMSSWTQKALQTLAANQVFASMQYSGINTPAPLITQNNTLTSQGQTFRHIYEQFLPSAAPLPTLSLTPTASSTSSSTPSSTPTASPTTTDTPVATDTPVVSSPTTPGTTVVSSPAPVITPTPTTVVIATTPTPTPTLTPAPTLMPTPTPTTAPTPASTTYAVDGKNPTSYAVNGKTCAQTLSNSTPKTVSFNGATGTLYFQFSITCHAAWAKIVFSKSLAANTLGNAKIVRTGDGKAYTCDTGGNQAVAPGQTSCYTGMVYDGPNQTASAYASFKNNSGSTTWSSSLGPY